MRSRPVGNDIAGKPDTVQGRLKMLEPVVESPRGSVVKAMGMKIASTPAIRSHISRWKRILWRWYSTYSWPAIERVWTPTWSRLQEFGMTPSLLTPP